MSKMGVKMLSVVEKVVRKEIEHESSDWPICSGILHQPKRPESMKVSKETRV